MDITLNKKDSTNATIKIILKEADYQPNVDKKVKDYGKKANIKGFRPGKVPTSYIKKLYGKSILVEEINQLLSQSLNSYIKDEKLQVLGDPMPKQEDAAKIDWDNQKEFEFEYDLGLVDAFDLKLDEKFKVNKYIIKVDDKVMTETLDNLKEQYGEQEAVDEAEGGDILSGKLVSADEEEQQQVVLPLNDLEKKAQKQFIGAKKDDTVTFKVDKAFVSTEAKSRFFAKNETDAAEINGEYTLVITEIKRTKPAAVNQELFDKVFGKDAVKNMDEFNAKIKETMAENYNRETENLLARDIQNKVVEKTKIDLPDDFLKNWLLISNEGKVTQEQVAKEYDLYAKDLRWNLIKNKLAEHNESLKVENEEVMDHAREMIKQQFGQYGMSDQLENNIDSFANNYLQGENGENYRKVFEELISKKVMEHIKAQITITEKKVDLDGFKKAVDNN